MQRPQRAALVVSHERSGTHFLINTLAANFGYRPRVDVATRPGFDPRSTVQMLELLLADWPPEAVLKSHHQAAFFPLLPQLTERFAVFYVARDPRDALLSFWRFLAASPPGTGPPAGALASLGDFLRAVPSGSITLYDHRPAASMVERWSDHVAGWNAVISGVGGVSGVDASAATGAGAATAAVGAVARRPVPGGVTVVRYADLDERFAATVARLAAALGQPPPAAPLRPSPHSGVIHPGPGGSGRHRAVFSAADQALVRDIAGDAARAFDLLAPG